MYSDAAQWSNIRRLILEQGTPIRQVAQEHGISRKTVRKMIQHPFPVPCGKGGRVRAKLGPYTSLIQSLLQENTLLPRSARLSVSAIFKRLRDKEGFTGTYRTMQDYIRSIARSSGCIGQSAFDLLASVKQGQADDFLFLVPKAGRPVVPRDHTGPPLLEVGRAVSITHNPSDRVQARQAAFEWMHTVLQNKASHDALCREVGDVPGFESLLEHPYDGRLSNRNRAMVVLASRCGLSKSVICRFLRIDRKTGRRYLRTFEKGGEAALFARQTKSHRKFDNETIKRAVFGLLHQPPSNFRINRTTWIMADLVRVMKQSGQPVCSHVIRKIVKGAGYRWRKARIVLTSADPEYTEKLDRIYSILSGLRPDEAFFSIDEFGLFAVKMTSGRVLRAPGEQHAVPQWQKSRGCLIMTAALELSGNQVTHFYSLKKNTTEMIGMMELLVDRYRDRQKLYLSWDCASWHISKRLHQRIEKHNATALSGGGPIVDTAPLPSGAQFLNVIESVFSGMARTIIHNSDIRRWTTQKQQLTATSQAEMSISDSSRKKLERRFGVRNGNRQRSRMRTTARTHVTAEVLMQSGSENIIVPPRDAATFRRKCPGRTMSGSGIVEPLYPRTGAAAYGRNSIFRGEAPMAKAPPGRPRTQRAQKSAVQEAPSEAPREEEADQPAFIKALENLNIGKLRRVIAFAEVRIREREASEKAAAREELQKLAQERGFSMADLFGGLAPHAPAKRGRKPDGEGKSERAPVEAKYRGPNGETWSGRGRMPKWLHAAEAEGKSTDSFLISPG